MQAEILLLRLVHVLSGLVWVGAMVFMSVFLMPAMQQAGPAGGAVMNALQQRRLMTFMPVVAMLTLLSGLRLYWIMSDGFSAAYVESSAGATFGVAGLLSIAAFVLGLVVLRPAMARAGALAQQLPTAPEAERPALQAEIQRLRARGRPVGLAAAVLLVLAAAGMAVARYV
jgi:uncharacterized membrane protein